MSDSSAIAAFNDHVASGVGWTEFARMHTQISGSEYKRAFLAGYHAGRLINREMKDEAVHNTPQNRPDTATILKGDP